MRSLVPLLVLAVCVTALVLMFLWRDQASYKPLFGEKEKVAAADMMSVLDAQGIPYRLHPETGQLLVPEAQLGAVRMLLASKGVVAQLPAGLELMDRNDPLGVSQFVQDVRFRRGLEGELAQSIRTLDAVESARVHLSIAKSSSFVVGDGSKSSASVVVGLKRGQSLTPEQIAAIVNLVANSVASLEPQRVSLVDQAGNLLSAQVDLSDGFEPGQGNEAANRYQDETRRNVRDLLEPVLGGENFKVSVSAVVDNDRVQETHERYGEAPRVTNEATREESGREALALGVPGSLSNRPVNVPPAPAAGAAVDPNDNASTAQKSASTRQYAYDRSITQIQRSRGRLNKLNVAVVLNSLAAPGGAATWTPEALADVERLLRSGLGIDAQRGDTLVVTAMAFPQRSAETLPWWQERDTIVDATSWGLQALGVLLAFLLVVRPLLKIAQRRWAPVQGAAERDITPDTPVLAGPDGEGHESGQGGQGRERTAGALPAATPAGGMAVVPLLENYELPPPGSPVDVLVDHLKVLASKEPERVAEVVKQWVQKNGRTEQAG